MSITVDKTFLRFFCDKITNTRKTESKCPLLFMLFVVANLNVRIYINAWFLLRATIKWLKESLLLFVDFFNQLLGPFTHVL